MDGNFTCEAILLVVRHNTAPPSFIAYSSVVVREIVRLAFLISGLNDIYICACNIGNAYLNSPCRGKLWNKAGS